MRVDTVLMPEPQGDTAYILECRTDTTWLPKVQRWFTPGEMEVFDAWMSGLMPPKAEIDTTLVSVAAQTSADMIDSILDAWGW